MVPHDVSFTLTHASYGHVELTTDSHFVLFAWNFRIVRRRLYNERSSGMELGLSSPASTTHARSVTSTAVETTPTMPRPTTNSL